MMAFLNNDIFCGTGIFAGWGSRAHHNFRLEQYSATVRGLLAVKF